MFCFLDDKERLGEPKSIELRTHVEVPTFVLKPGLDISTPVILPSENIYESAAKLLFLSVKWARTIPSFLQVCSECF